MYFSLPGSGFTSLIIDILLQIYTHYPIIHTWEIIIIASFHAM